jgi:hypothetical protein
MLTTINSESGEIRRCKPIRTTLYELIEALNNLLPPEEEHLVVATVVHLLRTGRLTYPASLAQNN